MKHYQLNFVLSFLNCWSTTYLGALSIESCIMRRSSRVSLVPHATLWLFNCSNCYLCGYYMCLISQSHFQCERIPTILETTTQFLMRNEIFYCLKWCLLNSRHLPLMVISSLLSYASHLVMVFMGHERVPYTSTRPGSNCVLAYIGGYLSASQP